MSARKTFTAGSAVEIVADPTSGALPDNLWEPAEYVEPVGGRGRYRNWHWTWSETTGQVCVPPRRILERKS